MKYCFYKMTVDSGLAPNPFYGCCTLALCTPNHMSANLEPGDVIVGFESDRLRNYRLSKKGENRTSKNALIYYMVIDEILSLDTYFNDPRFRNKKPEPNSRSLKKHMGDNAYFRDSNGDWRWILGHGHNTDKSRKRSKTINQDLKGNRVFIANEYFYFGDKAIPFPRWYKTHVPSNQGIKYCRKPLPGFDRYVRDKAKKYGCVGEIGQPIHTALSENHCAPREHEPGHVLP